jgi:hypothetical protein
MNPTYTVVQPAGETGQATGSLPHVGHDIDGYRVDFVDTRRSPPIVYLGLHYGQGDFVKLVFVAIDGRQHPLTLAEAAELAARLRRIDDEAGSATNAVAVRLEQLIEEDVTTPMAEFLGAEEAALRLTTLTWDVGNESVPRRVEALRDALLSRADHGNP